MRSFNLGLGDEYSNQLAKFIPELLDNQYNEWSKFAHSYTYDDRGRASLGIIKRGEEGNFVIYDGMIANMKKSCGEILKIAANFIDAVPVANYDIINMNNLEELVFEPLIDFVADELPEREEKRGRKILYPEEVAFIIERFSRAYHLPSQILGRSILYLTLSNGTTDDLNDVIGRFYGFTKAFYVKWKGKFNCRYGKAGKEQLAIITYYLVDSLNGSRRQILPWAIKTKSPERLIEKNPQSGINKVIISDEDSIKKSEEIINQMLKNRQHNRLTPSQLLRLRSSRREYGRYLKKVYQKNKVTEHEETKEDLPTYIA